jgi:hypothetical protein
MSLINRKHFNILGAYVLIVTILTSSFLTYILYSTYVHNRRINTRVDFANTNAYTWPSRVVHKTGTLDLLIQGSEHLRSNVEYSLFIHVTFLDSWTTALSGLLTFLSDFGHGQHTVSSLVPCVDSPIVWALKHMFLCPVYATGLVTGTIEQDILLSTSFRSVLTDVYRLVDVPVYPVHIRTLDYVARVQVIPSSRGHVPDILTISAWYQPSHLHSANWTWWYLSVFLYICSIFSILATSLLILIVNVYHYTHRLMIHSACE